MVEFVFRTDFVDVIFYDKQIMETVNITQEFGKLSAIEGGGDEICGR